MKRGDTISIDGGSGDVMLGKVPQVEPVLPLEYERLMTWADAARTLRVRANADTGSDAARARAFGAEGIGLCRTEHMFFGEDRILAVRQMILAGSAAARRTALAKILPMQRADFVEIFKAMTGWPVTVRLLDPPLHEFLPHGQDEMEQLAEAMEVDERDVARRVQSLQEFNPMLGHRGVRLAITYPEIYEVQTRAIMEAACQLAAAGVGGAPGADGAAGGAAAGVGGGTRADRGGGGGGDRGNGHRGGVHGGDHDRVAAGPASRRLRWRIRRTSSRSERTT